MRTKALLEGLNNEQTTRHFHISAEEIRQKNRQNIQAIHSC